jgi:catechol 2,3-dioxygenase-like lactoylglutathione lyase family enzyme
VIVEINGIAHVQLSVNDLERAMTFYERVLGFMGMRAVAKGATGLYMVGGRTAVAISRASAEHLECRFDQRRIGLHHVCFRARSRDDVDALYAFLREHGVTIVRAPEPGPWAPGYYSVLFEDPDGIRLEVNFVPGKGHLEDKGRLPYDTMPGYGDTSA